ncbi:hypothetical protein NE619_12945 [Anaerovorax odorimutans]|uniref:Uncharacterized protein n=1 Tax=Anaerovorax odorimutans TaxID=109327 RepID=A0ABT1RR09_9FIRM|nr:hypothetical protein [Anaerovorax odorimutans]
MGEQAECLLIFEGGEARYPAVLLARCNYNCCSYAKLWALGYLKS